MNDWANWIANGLPLLLIVILFVYFTRSKKWRSPLNTLVEKQTEVLEQQLTVLRETNDLLKRLSQSRG